MGAVNWRSPEYLTGGRPSFASDVYSFAMCIIEVMSGDIPWGKMISAAVRYQVLRRNNIPNLPESMSEKQRNLIELMTKKEPSGRVKITFVTFVTFVAEKLREFAQDGMALEFAQDVMPFVAEELLEFAQDGMAFVMEGGMAFVAGFLLPSLL
uniref:Protein kinase domain-containing protein n=1 Tax=Globisporangium ultimum (strain ATCC 200006 / CBS 805.95 / DAOM BR144) TaxID=431595 RepID=K3XCF1_GLOUD